MRYMGPKEGGGHKVHGAQGGGGHEVHGAQGGAGVEMGGPVAEVGKADHTIGWLLGLTCFFCVWEADHRLAAGIDEAETQI